MWYTKIIRMSIIFQYITQHYFKVSLCLSFNPCRLMVATCDPNCQLSSKWKSAACVIYIIHFMFIAQFNNTDIMTLALEKQRITNVICCGTCPNVSLQLQCVVIMYSIVGGVNCPLTSYELSRTGTSSILHICTSCSYMISSNITVQDCFFTIFDSHGLLHYSFCVIV